MTGEGPRVRASVAGGAVAGELTGTAGLRVALHASVLRDATALARHLEALARALWVARTRAFLAAVSAAAGEPVAREPPALGRRAQEYVARRAVIVARGCSRDGLVAVRVEGMRRWRVEIAPEACASVAVAEAAVREAGEALLRDQAARIRALKRTIWQPVGTADVRAPVEPGADILLREAPS
ncbi:hypothetical protein [Dactylosporangium sp. NPDC051484]|uniref:hypothetical protein n=1 Tax=Dactylosporangium sp. NPDC051484 TaxID=3154942 RepID=UPI00344D85E6